MCLSDMSGCNLIGLSSSIAIAISQDLSVDEITTLSAFVTTIGDNLAIIATQKAFEESNKSTSSYNQSIDC